MISYTHRHYSSMCTAHTNIDQLGHPTVPNRPELHVAFISWAYTPSQGQGPFESIDLLVRHIV